MKIQSLLGLLAVGLLLVMCRPDSTQAQVDQRKMAASVAKATQKLKSMFSKPKEKEINNIRGHIHFSWGRQASGVYVPGYGVVFKLPRVMLGIRSRTVRRNRKNGDLFISLGNRARMRLTSGNYNYRDRVYYMRTGGRDAYEYRLVDRDSVIVARKKMIKQKMQEFIAQANDIMSQLPDNERIELIYKYPNRYNSYYYGSNRRSKSKLQMPDQIMASISKKTWQRNKNKVDIQETQTKKTIPNFQVMSGVIKGLYRQNVTKSYYSYSDVTYQPLNKFGVLYSLRFYERVNADEDESYVHIRDGEVIDSDSLRARKSGNYEAIKTKRQQVNQKAYQIFEQEIKQYLIEYGKLIQGLSDNETLALHVTMPQHWYTADDSKVPKGVLLTIKASVLKGVKSGKMTEESAKNEVKLIKL